jgi:hypothetical protein
MDKITFSEKANQTKFIFEDLTNKYHLLMVKPWEIYQIPNVSVSISIYNSARQSAGSINISVKLHEG